MVYLVPELEEILQSGQKPIVHLNIDKYVLQLEIRLMWQRFYGDIPFAGFEFININPYTQDILAQLAEKYLT